MLPLVLAPVLVLIVAPLVVAALALALMLALAFIPPVRVLLVRGFTTFVAPRHWCPGRGICARHP